MGINELKAQNIPMAMKRFNQAIQLSTNNEHKTNAYLAVGNYNFSNRQFQSAAIYYDSANAIIDKSHPDFEEIVQKNDILGDLLKEVMTVYNNDSLLRMAKDPKWRSEKIAQAIDREKKEAEAAQKAQALAQARKDNSGMPPAGGFGGMGGAPNDMPAMSSGNSSFPFYNSLNRSKSSQEFQKIWGARENKDNWKYAAKKTASDENLNTTSDTSQKQISKSTVKDSLPANIPANIAEGEKKYYANLPLTEKAQKQALLEIEKALFEGGKIYQDRLQEYNEAIRLFVELVTRFPFSENIPQALYELIKVNRLIGDYSQADVWKAKLLSNHPKSVYVRMLETGGSLSDVAKTNSGNQQIDSLFALMLGAYNANQFNVALDIKNRADKDFAGNQLQTKFDYLQALCFIKSGNSPKGIELLEQLVIDYPSSEIALRARDIIEANTRLKAEAAAANAPKSEATMSFTAAKPNETIDCIFTFSKGTNTNMIRAALSDFGKTQFSFENLLVNPSTAVGSQNVIRISQFSKPEIAKEFVAFLQKSTSYFAEKGLYEYNAMWISESNYLHLTKSLDLNGYRTFFEKQ
jgi:tetratricopeptide (TPR) repeat protein